MENPFYLGNGRAMISIGPLTDKVHCSFKCPFCYVKSEEFMKYEKWDIPRILDWLNENLEQIDIIYVSGDTDSFAKPRTGMGLDLLDRISYLKKDILFTTRFVFNSVDHPKLKSIIERIKSNGNIGLACVSVCQLTQEFLEPKPIQNSERRLSQLGTFSDLGWIPILAMRPLLPQVPHSDYSSILEFASHYTCWGLISDYYYDPLGPQIKPVSDSKHIGNVFFNTKKSDNWEVVEASETLLQLINKKATESGIKIFDSSTTLYNFIKQKQ